MIEVQNAAFSCRMGYFHEWNQSISWHLIYNFPSFAFLSATAQFIVTDWGFVGGAIHNWSQLKIYTIYNELQSLAMLMSF